MKTMKRFAARICALFVVLTVSLTALVPAAFAFAALWGLVGVWLAVPVTEAVTAAAGYLVLRRERARGFGGELQP